MFAKNPPSYLTKSFILTSVSLPVSVLFGLAFYSAHAGFEGTADPGTNLFILLLPVFVLIRTAVIYILFRSLLKNTRDLLVNALIWDISDRITPGIRELLSVSKRLSFLGWLTGAALFFLNTLAAFWLSGTDRFVPLLMIFLSCLSAVTVMAMIEYILLSAQVSPVLDWIKQKKIKNGFESVLSFDESIWMYGLFLFLSSILQGMMVKYSIELQRLSGLPSSAGKGSLLWVAVWAGFGIWIFIRRKKQWRLFHEYINRIGGQTADMPDSVRIVPELWLLLYKIELITGRFYELFLNIENDSSEMNAAAKVVTETSSEQNSALIRQSASVTQTSSTLQELVQASKQIADSASAVVGYAENTEKKADHGLKVMKDSVSRVQKVREGNEINLSEVIVLSEAIIEIDHVLNFIISIADETNLIALNAAIEASSAGEQGKRFKIVAGEVRQLSTRVTKSIRTIKDITRRIQEATSRLVQTVQDHQEVIDESVQWVSQALVNLEEILEGAVQSADAAKQIYVAIQQQKIANQQIAISFSDISSDIHQIASASDRYDQYVRTLRKFSSNIEGALQSLNLGQLPEKGDEWNLR